jgi:3-oxocholest-4-en-26-oyl-CoA dehydrogenase alpha subunit
MNITSVKEENFRKEVRDFIKKEFPEELRWKFGISYSPWIESHTGEEFEYIKKLRRKFGEKGYFSLSWPEKYGGRGSFVLQTIFDEEMLYTNCPAMEHCGVTFFSPTLIIFGTEEQKRKYLPGIASGETSWCELVSEPDAGSDLAALKTTGVLKGNNYIINGQKTWCTGAHHSPMGFIILRTETTQSRHAGLTYFMIEMDTPGISINPIRNLAGEHEFNEVFFNDVPVPVENIVGGLGQGWAVTMKTLDYERVSHEYYASVIGYLDHLVKYFKANKIELNDSFKERLARLYSECEMARMLHYKAIDVISSGISSTYECAMDKMYNCELGQRASEFSIQALGRNGLLLPGSAYTPLDGWPAKYYMSTASYATYAGSSEVDRNVIAGQGLKLPNK